MYRLPLFNKRGGEDFNFIENVSFSRLDPVETQALLQLNTHHKIRHCPFRYLKMLHCVDLLQFVDEFAKHLCCLCVADAAENLNDAATKHLQVATVFHRHNYHFRTTAIKFGNCWITLMNFFERNLSIASHVSHKIDNGRCFHVCVVNGYTERRARKWCKNATLFDKTKRKCDDDYQ